MDSFVIATTESEFPPTRVHSCGQKWGLTVAVAADHKDKLNVDYEWEAFIAGKILTGPSRLDWRPTPRMINR
ncbi:CLUMA_CG010250, isoform A [Clunio marinus]|uniref:CLUMA_CG010250, isoform A n=1 Tax=Clunio marinus TaxID=568069 RepID=A0A1J1I8U0_9DIPT|nr:CLUMA_CG010250, isoform A [Clunio marinus]